MKKIKSYLPFTLEVIATILVYAIVIYVPVLIFIAKHGGYSC